MATCLLCIAWKNKKRNVKKQNKKQNNYSCKEWTWDLTHWNMFCSAVSTVQFLLSEFRSLPSFPLALVTIILCMSIWVTAWPPLAFSTHWQKWRVNSGRHCKGGWLWVRTINGFNLAPANSYCTYSWCKEHQISYETHKTICHILLFWNTGNVLVTVEA